MATSRRGLRSPSRSGGAGHRNRRAGTSRVITLTYKCLPLSLRGLFLRGACRHRAHRPLHALIRVFEDVCRYFVITHAHQRPVPVWSEPSHTARFVICATGIAHLEEQRIAADDSEKHAVAIEAESAEHATERNTLGTGELFEHPAQVIILAAHRLLPALRRFEGHYDGVASPPSTTAVAEISTNKSDAIN